MVHVLIALRRTILRNQLARTNPAMLLTGAVLVLISAVGTIWLGLVSYPNPDAATDVLALVFLLWVAGRVTQSALAGAAPLPARRRPARPGRAVHGDRIRLADRLGRLPGRGSRRHRRAGRRLDADAGERGIHDRRGRAGPGLATRARRRHDRDRGRAQRGRG